uniref:Reverse transcriptase domain-containing protein n=1 Tax=Amphimedon queenslandica TaxID=400682 RepID=A0A1X7SFW8_AMPQE
MKELEEMERDGIIEKSSSEWASPLVIVKKKDGGIRLCVDYRQLNQVTKFDAYPMPRVEELLDTIGDAEFITTLDLAKGYWQVPVNEKDREKTAFTSPRGLYQFKTMPFGLSGAPATFQRMMDEILRGTETFAGVYLDDIVIHSSIWRDHLNQLTDVLKRLDDARLTRWSLILQPYNFTIQHRKGLANANAVSRLERKSTSCQRGREEICVLVVSLVLIKNK